MHDRHSGNDEAQPDHGRQVQFLVEEESAHQGNDDHTYA